MHFYFDFGAMPLDSVVDKHHGPTHRRSHSTRARNYATYCPREAIVDEPASKAEISQISVVVNAAFTGD